MNLTPQTRIGDLVLETPAAMRVFEELNVDYCCGGHRSMTEACAQAGRTYEEVAAKLATLSGQETAPSDPSVWREAPLTELIAHIESTHHVFTRTELARVAPLMEKVLRVHGEHHAELERVAECFQAMADDLVPHLEKEEQILFPYVRKMEAGAAPSDCCFGTVQNPVRAMMMEHDQVGEILRELRSLTGGFNPPEDACGSYRSLFMGLHALEQDLHQHIYLENHLLFPRAVALEEAVQA
jgi:regulator of cell morphogenesis and NO signaling